MFPAKLKKWDGGQLVNLHSVEAIAGNPNVFNVVFAAKRTIRKPGVYAIFFDDSLLYVGKYQGKKSDPFAGDVVRDRWAKHLATITCRGKSLSMSKKTLSITRREISGSLSKASLATSLLDCDDDVTVTDRGCVTSLPRVRFALRNWDQFSDDLQQTLNRFTFAYLSVDRAEANLNSKIRQRVSELEELLIEYLQPELNVVGVAGGAKPLSLDLDSYSRLIFRFAGRSSPPQFITDEAMVGASEKFFFEKSVEPSLEVAFFALVESLQCSDGVDYYFTDSPDFRIKTVVSGINRVVATLRYIPSKQEVRLRSLCSIDLVDWPCRKIKDTLPYEYRIDTSFMQKQSLTEPISHLLTQCVQVSA